MLSFTGGTATDASAHPHWRALVGSTWSADEAATLAHVAHTGSPGVMGAIAQAESGGNPDAVSPTGDYGLFQINRASWGFSVPAIFNPWVNVQWAKKVKNEQGLGAWTTYPPPGPRGEVKHRLAQRIRHALH